MIRVDTGNDGEFFPSESGDSATLTGREPHVLGLAQGTPVSEERTQFIAGHISHYPRFPYRLGGHALARHALAFLAWLALGEAGCHDPTNNRMQASPPVTPWSSAGSRTRGPVTLAVVAAVTVASVYYGQPILSSLGRSFGVHTDAAGLVVVAALIGSALAQLLVVPLVDQVERRRLGQSVLAVQLVGLLGMAVAPNLIVAVLSSILIGVGASAAMTLLSYAVGLARHDERGRVTGIVMSGVLFGILLSRGVSGFISSWAGWRTTYLVAAASCVAAILTLQAMPLSRGHLQRVGYPRLLRSLAGVVQRQPPGAAAHVPRRAGVCRFNLLWTGLTLFLSGPAYG